MKKFYLAKAIFSIVFVSSITSSAYGQTDIMPLGDSITKGVKGSTPDGGYRDDLSVLLTEGLQIFNFVGTEKDPPDPAPFDNDHQGVNLLTSADMVTMVDGWLTLNLPDLVILNIGTNDIAQGRNGENIITDIGAIVDKIVAKNSAAKIIMSTVTPRADDDDLDSEVDALNIAIVDLISQKASMGVQIILADPNSVFKANPNWKTEHMDPDGVHPNNSGYAVMAQIYFDAITSDPSTDLIHVEEFADSTAFAQDWTFGPELVVTGGELKNTNIAPITDWSLAVFNKLTNAVEVTMVYASSATSQGIQQAGLALRLSADDLAANGYLIRYNGSNNNFELFSIVAGSPDQTIESRSAGSFPVAAGDTLKVIMSTDGGGHHFAISVNGNDVGDLTDDLKTQGNEGMLYAGVLLAGDESNNVDRWTYRRPFDLVPPEAITDLQVKNISGSSASIEWTAPAEDGSSGGPVQSYDIRYSTSLITQSNFLFTTQAPNPPVPAFPGVIQNFAIAGLAGSTTYYFAIISRDEVGNASLISNVPFATTSELVCTVDDFSTPTFGTQWTLGSEFVVTAGEMENTYTLDSGWEHIAVYNDIKNATEVSLQYGLGSDATGRGGTGLALMLDASSSTANGYLCYVKTDNTLQLWRIIGGSPVTKISSLNSTQAPTAAGDGFKVITSTSPSGHEFEFFVRGISAGKLTDPNKLEGTGSTLFSGAVLRGSRMNNIDNVTLCSEPGNPTTFTKTGGDNQTGTINAPLANSLCVKVSDQNGNPVPGIGVIFDVVLGGGSVEPVVNQNNIFIEAESGTVVSPMVINNDPLASGGAYVRTPNSGGNGNGHVTFSFNVPAAGNYKIWGRCIAPGGTSDSFYYSIDGELDSGNEWDVFQGISVSGWEWDEISRRGNGSGAAPQVDPVIFNFLSPGIHTLRIRTRDADTQLDKVLITNNLNFVPVGTAEGNTPITDENGEAKAVWTLGPNIGTDNNMLDATVQGFSVLGTRSFTASATPDTADIITISSGNDQNGSAGQPLAAPFQVLILGKLGTPVPNHDVTFTVTEGGGNFGGPIQTTVQTNASGFASATLTLGSEAGATNKATAEADFQGTTLTNSPVTFMATSGVPDKLEAVSSTSQNGTVNLPLADSIEVRIRDSIGNPLPGFSVKFSVITAGGFEPGRVNGSTDSVAVITDASGIAKAQWNLGPSVGTDNNKLEVSASVPNGSPIAFLASAAVGAASNLIFVSGNDQAGKIQTNLDSLFVVKVTDDSDNIVVGWPVKFKVVAGGGKIAGQDSVTEFTNSSGEASVTLTLGSTAATAQDPFNNRVEASSDNAGQLLNGSPRTFRAKATASDASDLLEVAGNNQSGRAAEALAQPIQVKVTDGLPSHNGISGHEVRFKITGGGGTIFDLTTTDTVITTDSNGLASVTWYMGGDLTANAQELQASADDGVDDLQTSPRTFQATATAGAVDPDASFLTASPSTVLADGQSRTTLTVTLTDKFGNPIPGSPVTLNSSGSNNIFQQPQNTTDSSGKVTATLASTSAEIKTVSARIIGGISLNSFTNVTFIPLAPEKVTISSGDSQSGNIGTALDQPMEVLVTDKNNNNVPGIDVTFQVAGGGGYLMDESSTSQGQSVTVQSDSLGKARAIWILGTTAGTNTAEAAVSFNGSELTGSPRNFIGTGVTASATTLAIFDGDNQQGGIAGLTLPKPLQVKIMDAAGKPVFDVPVNFTVQLGGGTFANANPRTDYRGIAETMFALGTIVGTNLVNASSGSLAGSPATFTFLSVVGTPAILTAKIGSGGSAVVNSLYSIAAEITDINGNPIEGANTNFAIVEGSGSIEDPQNPLTDAAGLAPRQVRLPTTMGDLVVKVTSIDLPGFFDTFAITALAAAATNIAEFSGNNQDGTIGRELPMPFKVRVTDPFGNPVSRYEVQWVRTIGSGSPSSSAVMTDEEGLSSFNYTLGNAVGANEVRAITALNPSTIIFSATGVTNNFPLFSGLTDRSVVEGNTLQFQVTASDADSDPITYEAQNVPTNLGASFDNNSRTFSWTPAVGVIGDFQVTFIARDNKGGLDSETITISVLSTNNPPVIDSFTPAQLDVQFNLGQTINFSVNVSDPDGDDIEYLWLLFNDLNSSGEPFSTSFNYEFITSAYSSGTYIVRVEVTDKRDTVVVEWRIDLVTSVELASFEAQFGGFDGVQISWTTSREIDNLGFDILRSRSEDGTYTKITDEFVPADSDGQYQFIDKNIQVGVRYYYKLEDVNLNGVRTEHGPISVEITPPESFELSQNYPNPFNPETKIRYQLPNSGEVVLKIFDILGREVKSLVNEKLEAGFHEVTWNGRNNSGRKVSSGVYYYQIRASEFKETKKMILMK